jgi:phospholipid transport system substrate-binding protein
VRIYAKQTKILLLTGVFLVAAPAAFAMPGAVVQPAATPLMTEVAADAEGARKFVDGMTQRGIAFLSNEKMTDAQRKAEFKKLLEDSFDTDTIGRFVLGRHWRTASSAQQKEYLSLFKNMIVQVYSNRFKEYQGQTIEVTSVRAEGDSDALVSSVILPNGRGSKVSVDWRVREKNGRYKVIDVMVEGVSMAVTQRSDFASVIQRGGGDLEVLLQHMRGQ